MSYKFIELKRYLNDNSINFSSDIPDDTLIQGINSVEIADNHQITFYTNYKYLDALRSTKAKACFIKKDYINFLPNTCIPIIVNDPYLAFAYSTNFFYPRKSSNNIIQKNSNISKDAKIESNVEIGNFVSIHKRTIIKKNTIIGDNVVIGSNVVIGKSSMIKSGCILSNCIIGDNCIIQSGSIIGDQGFGFTLKDKIEIRHIGNVQIGNNVQIGSNTTIDRAALGSTLIGNNVRIDNLVQIAHNVKIGDNTVIAAQCGIAGSTIIGTNCILGGQAGISGHLNIGNFVTIAGKSGVTKNLKDNMVVAGFPAIDIKKWKKNIIKQYKETK